MPTFVEDLEGYVYEKLASLDLLKEPNIGAVDRSEVVRRLKMALKNELEASEIAAIWIPTTPEVEVKLALARQVGDEAKHYRFIEDHLRRMGVDLAGFDPGAGGYGPMFQLLAGFNTTVERIGAAQFTRESLALKKNEQFIEFCEAAGIKKRRDFIANRSSRTSNGMCSWDARFSSDMPRRRKSSPARVKRSRLYWILLCGSRTNSSKR